VSARARAGDGGEPVREDGGVGGRFGRWCVRGDLVEVVKWARRIGRMEGDEGGVYVVRG
jgi:hypothetical protein